MSKSTVYSLRIPYVTTAQCYDLLEAAGIPTANLKPSTAIRTALEALFKRLEEAGHVSHYTDSEAITLINKITGELQATAIADDLSSLFTKPAEPHVIHMTSSLQTPEVIEDPDERAEARARIHDLISPQVEAAREAQEQERFHFVGNNEGKPAREASAQAISAEPPWLNAKVASTDEFAYAVEQSDFCAAVEAQRNQLGAVAARMVLPNLSTGMLGTEVAERLFFQTYEYLVDYLKLNQNVEVPLTFPEGQEEEPNVTVPPEINHTE